MFLIYLAASLPNTGPAHRKLSVTTSRPRQVVAAACLSFPGHSALLGCELHENRDEPGLLESSMPSKETGMWRGSTNV